MTALQSAPPGGAIASVGQQRGRDRRVWWMIYGATMLFGLFFAAAAYKRSQQLYFGFGFLAVFLLLAAWTKFPRAALAVTVTATLTSDIVTVSWFPFTKNLSSRESILYLSDAVSFSPLELSLIAGLALTIYRNLASTRRILEWTPLLTPLLAFLALAFVGLVLGVARGGDISIAIVEFRPVIYLPLLYFLIVSVCRTRRDYAGMFLAAIIGIEISVILSIDYFTDLSEEVRSELASLNEHGAAISMNLMILMFITSLVYRRVATSVSVGLFLLTIPAAFVYIVAQRRAAIVSLGAALILLAVTLAWRQRRTFWKVVPIASLVIVGYVGAFWNSDSAAAFPAQAVKGVIAPDDASAADQSSDLYREIEKFDLSFTIRSSPVTGLGFGHPFLRPIPLPALDTFALNEYLPHNSLLYIWIKMGFFGFAALFVVLARGIAQGAARIRTARDGMDALMAMCAVGFVVMYTVYLYVEVAWEPRNVMLLALSLALCTAPLADQDDQQNEDQRQQKPTVTPVESDAKRPVTRLAPARASAR